MADGWKPVRPHAAAEFVAMRLDAPVTRINGRELHCGDYIVMIPALGHHWYMTAKQFEEHFTLEGSNGR